MNRTSMSPVSAIQVLADWIEQHGRPPLREDCGKKHGLPHYQTLQYVCGGLTRAVALAQAYLIVGSAALSGLACPEGRSACSCSTRMTTCLRCGRGIVWEGAHVRQCAACRKLREADEAGVLVTAGTQAWMRGRWEVLEDLVDWNGG